MPERSHRRLRGASITGSSKTQSHRRPSPLPSTGQLSPSSSSWRHPEVGIEMLKRWSTEPELPGFREHELHHGVVDPEDSGSGPGALIRPQTCTNIFAPTISLLESSPRFGSEVRKKDTKILVNVTVQGSPGPVKVVAKLSSSVEETIKLVVDKYNAESRAPKLDRDSSSVFELHYSYFSLQSLDKSELMGDIGSRNFYLRTWATGNRASGSLVLDAQSEPSSRRISHPPPKANLLLLFPSLIAKRICKLVRRTCKFWRTLVCL